MQSIDDKILVKIGKAKRGTLFFADDFITYGTAKAVAKALERLEFKEELVRVARGIYARLEVDPILGPVKPGTEAIAEAIRRRDKAKIIPTGAMAMNALGLSTQVPINAVYLTNGTARKINLGKRTIILGQVKGIQNSCGCKLHLKIGDITECLFDIMQIPWIFKTVQIRPGCL